MKTAILLATCKGDTLAVKFLAHGPFSEILAEFKNRVANDRGEPGYDSLEIWTGPPAKTAHRLSSGDEQTAPEVPAEAPAPCPAIQQLDEYLAKLTDEQIREQFGEAFPDQATREEMITTVLARATAAYGVAKATFEAMSDEDLEIEADEMGITFAEGLTREEKIALLLDGPESTFPGAPPQGEEGPDPQGSTDLPGPDKGASASGSQPTGDGAPPTGSGDSKPGESTPGSLAPKGKAAKK